MAPVTEEASQGAVPPAAAVVAARELDGILDGIVYAGMVGIGFAFTENILYLAAAYNGTDGMGPAAPRAPATFVVRCLFSPFAHPLFTAVHRHRRRHRGRPQAAVRSWRPSLGYLLAVLAHATWNASTVFGFDSFVGVYLVLMVPAFVGDGGFAVWSRRSERRMLTAALGDAAQRGLIPATDIGWLVDLGARRAGRAFARQHGGKPASEAMRDYQQAAIELGFLHHRYLRGTRRRTSPRAASSTSTGSARCVPPSPSPDRWCPRR